MLPRSRRRTRTDGPPKSSRPPSGWPSPTATSTPHSPGGGRRSRRDRVDRRRRSSAPASCAAPARDFLESSTAPRKLGFWTKTAATSGHRAPQAGASGVQVVVLRRPSLGDLRAKADGVVSSVRPRSAVGNHARTTKLSCAPLAGAERQVRRRGEHATYTLVERRIGDGEGRSARIAIGLEHHLEAALGDLRLVRRVGG